MTSEQKSPTVIYSCRHCMHIVINIEDSLDLHRDGNLIHPP
jgi:hypothetical protein